MPQGRVLRPLAFVSAFPSALQGVRNNLCAARRREDSEKQMGEGGTNDARAGKKERGKRKCGKDIKTGEFTS